MTQYAAISALGKDRPGIVAAITKILYETGCNIEDSSMTLLRSEFAMILIAALPKGLSLNSLERKLAAEAGKGQLTVFIKPLTKGEEKKERPVGRPHIVSVYGADRPGIVYRISSFLAERGANITDVQTSVSGDGKKKTYIMFLEINLPSKTKYQEFKESLVKTAASLNVDVSVNSVDSPRL